MDKFKRIDNEVWTLRELDKFDAGVATGFTPPNNADMASDWIRSKKAQWLLPVAREMTCETHLVTDRLAWRVRVVGYVRDQDWTLFLLRWG